MDQLVGLNGEMELISEAVGNIIACLDLPIYQFIVVEKIQAKRETRRVISVAIMGALWGRKFGRSV